MRSRTSREGQPVDFILWRTRTTPSGKLLPFPHQLQTLNTKALSLSDLSVFGVLLSLSLIIKSRILFCVYQVIQSLW